MPTAYPTFSSHFNLGGPIAVPKHQPRYTIADYLEIDRASQDCYTYLDGEIFLMAGESPEHGDVSFNLATILGPQLKRTPCRARTKDTKVRSGPASNTHANVSGFFSYPDIVVICGEPEYHDERRDVVINPKAIFEVLSETTEAFDRSTKFERFKTWNPTLSDYILVAQDKPQVEHFHRLDDGTWSESIYTDLDASFTIASIGCTLNLADIYDRIRFAD